jgi:predicted transcriptional regulator
MIGLGLLEILGGAIIDGLWLTILGYFLHQITRFSYIQTVDQKILEGISVKDVMATQFTTVPPDTTIRAFLDKYVLGSKQYDFLATTDGIVTGVIEYSRIIQPSKVASDQTISQYIQPIAKNLMLKPEDSALKALHLLQQYNLHILPVLVKGKLVGVVLSRYLSDYVAIRRAQVGS